MKLSEAMRLGAMTGCQLFGRLEDSDGGTCAMGAVIKASGFETDSAVFNHYREIRTIYPALSLVVPESLIEYYDYIHTKKLLCWVIVFLNNELHWSREMIAEWIIDNGYDCESVDTPVVITQKEEVFA